MRKRYSRSYTVLSFLTMFSYREQPSVGCFFTYRYANRGEIACCKVETAAANINVYITKLDCLVLE